MLVLVNLKEGIIYLIRSTTAYRVYSAVFAKQLMNFQSLKLIQILTLPAKKAR